MRFPAAADRAVIAALRALPGVAAVAPAGSEASGVGAREMFARAELHGVASTIWDAWKAIGVPLDAGLAAKLDARALAREMDHEAHLAMLRRIDEALTVPAIALKGVLFAARYYARPSTRATTDIDLLVAETDTDRAIASLADAGYRVADSPAEHAWALREHHHVHLSRAHAPHLELHFRAYRGFGTTIRTEMLAERSVAVAGFRSIRVAAAEDELAYLAVHAAAHRFGRLGWLHDIRLLVEHMSPDALELAASRAREWGVKRALAFAGALLVEVLGVSPDVVRPLGALGGGRKLLIDAIVAEPRTRVLRIATRLAYTTMLADSRAASWRYARSYSVDRARRLLGLG